MDDYEIVGMVGDIVLYEYPTEDGKRFYGIGRESFRTALYRDRKLAIKRFIKEVMAGIKEDDFDYDDLAILLAIIDPKLNPNLD